jgi:ABC-type transport system substrate-binding protein
MNTQNTGARHIRWQMIIIASGVALLATLLIYVALTFTTSLVPARGGTYIEGMVGQPLALNPLLCQYNEVDRDLCSLIFDGMFYLDSNGLLRPDLAARLPDVSPEGLVYTVTLRSDVRWHDGQPFTADDVLFTVSLIKDPGFPGQEDLAELWRTIEISRVNTYNLSFTLREPFAPFPDYLTLGIAPAHILRSVPASDLASAPDHSRWMRSPLRTIRWIMSRCRRTPITSAARPFSTSSSSSSLRTMRPCSTLIARGKFRAFRMCLTAICPACVSFPACRFFLRRWRVIR